MNREYHKWHSPALDRDMELLVFGHAGARMLVLPTRKQRFFEYEDHGMVHSLRHRIDAGEVQLFCVDSVDDESLYCFDIPPETRIERHLQFERYLLDEVLPFSEKTNPDEHLIAHGCSFGAYHAMTLALRYPAHFSRVLAFSGRYDLTLHVAHFHSLFLGYDEPDLVSIMPSRFVGTLRESKRLRQIRQLEITLVIGENDPFCDDNIALSAAFKKVKVPHSLHFWCGEAHRFRYWRQMARVYL